MDPRIQLNMNQDNEPDAIMTTIMLREIEARIGALQSTNQFLKKWTVQRCAMTPVIQALTSICDRVRSRNRNLTMLGDGYAAQVYWHTGESMNIYASIICDLTRTKEISDAFDKVIRANTKPFAGKCEAEVTWSFSTPRGNQDMNITETISEVLHDEAYPIIGDVDKFIDDYLESDCSILLLHGTPGTGKSRLMRYIVQRWYTNQEAKSPTEEDCTATQSDLEFAMDGEINESDNPEVLFTSDRNVLSNSDEFFMNFRTGDFQFLVLEDMDNDLQPRSEGGNEIMHKFLGVSDGFIRNNLKKLLISTNLTVPKIDEALIRPGRCFGRVELGTITFDQAQLLAEKIEEGAGKRLSPHEDQKGWTVAQVYQAVKKQTSIHLRPMEGAGFMQGRKKPTG
jgi:hypothetical protein